MIQTNEREKERGVFPFFPVFPVFREKFPVSENSFSGTNFPSRNLGRKKYYFPSRSQKRERENYGV